MTGCVTVVALAGVALSTWWAAKSGITMAYRGATPSLFHFFSYYFGTLGRVFLGLVTMFWLARRFDPSLK